MQEQLQGGDQQTGSAADSRHGLPMACDLCLRSLLTFGLEKRVLLHYTPKSLSKQPLRMSVTLPPNCCRVTR